MRLTRLAGLTLLAGMSCAAKAHAEEHSPVPTLAHYYFRLDYRVAPGLRGCLSRADVRELLSGQLDYDAIHQDDGPGQIVLEMSRINGKVQARMVVDGAGEHWEATIDKASTCEDITLDALVNLNAAVTVLILIPLQKKLSAPEPVNKAPQLTIEPPPPPCPRCDAPTLPPPSPPPVLPEPRRYQLGLSAVFSKGTAPVVLGGVGWVAGVRWPKVSMALEGRMLFAPSTEIEGYGTRDKYNFAFVAASLSGCLYPWGTWAFACIRGEVGTLWSDFDHVPGHLTDSRVGFIGVGFRLGVEHILLPGLALRAYGEILGEPLSGSLALEKDGQLHLLWPGSLASGSVGFGPVVYFN